MQAFPQLPQSLAVPSGVSQPSSGLPLQSSKFAGQLWLGPQECSGAAPSLGGPGNLLDRLKDINITRCDEAAWRFLGISLAGYNAVISLALAAVALLGARVAARRS